MNAHHLRAYIAVPWLRHRHLVILSTVTMLKAALVIVKATAASKKPGKSGRAGGRPGTAALARPWSRGGVDEEVSPCTPAPKGNVAKS